MMGISPIQAKILLGSLYDYQVLLSLSLVASQLVWGLYLKVMGPHPFEANSSLASFLHFQKVLTAPYVIIFHSFEFKQSDDYK